MAKRNRNQRPRRSGGHITEDRGLEKGNRNHGEGRIGDHGLDRRASGLQGRKGGKVETGGGEIKLRGGEYRHSITEVDTELEGRDRASATTFLEPGT